MSQTATVTATWKAGAPAVVEELLGPEELRGGERQVVPREVRVDPAGEFGGRPAGPHLGDPPRARSVDGPLDAGADAAGPGMPSPGEVPGRRAAAERSAAFGEVSALVVRSIDAAAGR